jgi:hypothetical protein
VPDGALAALRDVIARQDCEIAWLRAQVAESRASVVAMADTKAHAQMEYFRAISQPVTPTSDAVVPPTKGPKIVAPPAEASVHYASLLAEGHLDGPVHEEDEEALFMRERERDLEAERVKVEGTDA